MDDGRVESGTDGGVAPTAEDIAQSDGSGGYQCSQCSYTADTYLSVARHFRDTHKPKPEPIPEKTVEEVTIPPKEAVDHPSHYGGADNPYEVIKVIEAWGLGFNLGNAVKYIARAGKKGDRLEDLKKALWYLQREIQNGPNRNISGS